MLFETIQRVTSGVFGIRSPQLPSYTFPRQIAGPDLVTRAVNSGPRHHIAELAHVARPRMALQKLDGLRRETAPRIVLLQEKSGERTNVFEALAQRWNVDLKRA